MHKKLKSLFLTTVFITAMTTAPITMADGINPTQLPTLATSVKNLISGSSSGTITRADVDLFKDASGHIFITALDASNQLLKYPDGRTVLKELDTATQTKLASSLTGYSMAVGLFLSSGIDSFKTYGTQYNNKFQEFKDKITELETKITTAKAGLSGLTGSDLSDLQSKITEAETALATAKGARDTAQPSFDTMNELIAYQGSFHLRRSIPAMTGSKRTVASTALISDLTAIMSALTSLQSTVSTYATRLIDPIVASAAPQMKPLKDIIKTIRDIARSTMPSSSGGSGSGGSGSGGSGSGGSGSGGTGSTGSVGVPITSGHSVIAPSPITGLELIKIVRKLVTVPKLGVPYKGIINNQISLNNQLLQRRAMYLQGLWLSGSIPLSDNSAKLNYAKYKNKDLNFSLGFDHLIAKKYLIGGFINYADNNNHSQNQKISFKQKQKSYAIGVYAHGRLNQHVYLGDKISYNTNKFDNKDSEIYPYLGQVHKMSTVDIDGFSNELYIGYQIQHNLLIETYLNTFYMQPSKFTQETHTTVTSPTPAISHTLTALGKIDNNIYNGFGIRGFWHQEKSLIDNLNVLPFTNAYLEMPFSGANLQGRYMHPNLPLPAYKKVDFDTLSSMNFGLRLGTTIAGTDKSDFVTTVAYNLNHVSSTAHSLDLTFSLKL